MNAGWPKIKLVDARGRTVTVFSRVPGPASARPVVTGGLSVTELLDFGTGVKPPFGGVPDDLRAQVIEEYANWIARFVADHQRWPGSDAEHQTADAVALTQALGDILAGHGLRLAERDELRGLARSAAADITWYVNCAELGRPDDSDGDMTLRVASTRFVGEPGDDTEWISNPKPRGKRATDHVRAEIARSGFAIPRNGDRPRPELPSIEDMTPVLDAIARNGQAGDILTLTLEQLHRLLAQRC